MNKERLLLEKFQEVLNSGKLYDFLENEVKEVVKNTYDSTLQGWYHHIILSNEGELYITGPLSVGSMSMGCYNGDEILLAKINASREFELELQWEDIEYAWEDTEVKNNNISAILDEIIIENEVEDLREECEEKGEDFTLERCLNWYCTYPHVEIAFKNLFPEKWEEIVNNYIDNMWEYDKEEIERNIENTIEGLKAHVIMAEEQEDDIKENLI